MKKDMTPRTLDHLVLPVANIDTARERLNALGFNVAPNGLHPFGTENCCVFFKDGTFLEPLGIAHRETCEAKALKGNTFVANDQAYRFRQGIEGFSSIVLKTDDAKADDKLYKSDGISGGKMVRFGRAFKTPDGQSGRVSFHLAFAADPRSPDSHFFTCQVLDAPKVDRSALQAHENGVVGISEILMSESNPTDFQYFFQTYLNQREMDVDSFGMSFETTNTKISVLSPAGLKAFFGLDVNCHERGMKFEAAILSVKSISITAALLSKNGVIHHTMRDRLVVPPAEGQGTTMIFEEVK